MKKVYLPIIIVLIALGFYFYPHRQIEKTDLSNTANTTLNTSPNTADVTLRVADKNLNTSPKLINTVIPKSDLLQKSSSSQVVVNNDSPILLSATTDKTKYTQDEPIEITLSAKNASTSPVTLYFNSGCELNYSINSYSFLRDMVCTASIPSIEIKAGETYVWTSLKHSPSQYVLPVGKQKIIIGITATKVNPFSGETLNYILPLNTSVAVDVIKNK